MGHNQPELTMDPWIVCLGKLDGQCLKCSSLQMVYTFRLAVMKPHCPGYEGMDRPGARFIFHPFCKGKIL